MGLINDIGYRENPNDPYFFHHPLLSVKHIVKTMPELNENLRGRRIQMVWKYDSFPGYYGTSGCLVWCTGTIQYVKQINERDKRYKRFRTGNLKNRKLWEANILFDKRPHLEESNEALFTLDPDLYNWFPWPEVENIWRLMKKDDE